MTQHTHTECDRCGREVEARIHQLHSWHTIKFVHDPNERDITEIHLCESCFETLTDVFLMHE